MSAESQANATEKLKQARVAAQDALNSIKHSSVNEVAALDTGATAARLATLDLAKAVGLISSAKEGTQP